MEKAVREVLRADKQRVWRKKRWVWAVAPVVFVIGALGSAIDGDGPTTATTPGQLPTTVTSTHTVTQTQTVTTETTTALPITTTAEPTTAPPANNGDVDNGDTHVYINPHIPGHHREHGICRHTRFC